MYPRLNSQLKALRLYRNKRLRAEAKYLVSGRMFFDVITENALVGYDYEKFGFNGGPVVLEYPYEQID